MVNQKYLAATVSTRPWDDLTALIRTDDTVELLSPCMNIVELVKSQSYGLLDIVFVDVKEMDLESAETGAALAAGFEPYLVFMADAYEPEIMRAAMQAGGRDFLIRPFGAKDLKDVLQRAGNYRQARMAAAGHGVETRAAENVAPADSRILTFFSTKGGAGKSTLAGNFAIAIAAETGKRVCIVDLALQFGDLALILNVKPRATIGNLADVPSQHIAEDIVSYLTPVRENVSLLAAPGRPEEAELIRPERVSEILRALAARFEYIIVDTAATFSDVSLAALDVSTEVFLIATPIILSVKNLKSAVELMEGTLHYPAEKLKIVLNRSDSDSGIGAADIESITARKIAYSVPSDGKVVVPSINRGVPAVLSNPGSKFSRALSAMARSEAVAAAPRSKQNGNGRFSLANLFRLKKTRRPDAKRTV